MSETLPQELLLHICSLVPESDTQLILALRLTCRAFYTAVMLRVDRVVSIDEMLVRDDIISVLGWMHRTLSGGPNDISQMMTCALRWLRDTESISHMMQRHFASLVFMNNIVQLLCVPNVTNTDLVAEYNQAIWDAGIALDEPRMLGMLTDPDSMCEWIVKACEKHACVRIYLRYHEVDETTGDYDIICMLGELSDDYHRTAILDHTRAQCCVTIAKSLLALRPHLLLHEDFDEVVQSDEFKQLCL